MHSPDPILQEARKALARRDHAGFLVLMTPITRAAATARRALAPEAEKLMCAYLCQVNELASPAEIAELLDLPVTP